MKSEVIVQEKEEIEYPCLMIGRRQGTIVLMTSKSTGTCVDTGGGCSELGEYSENWDMKVFQPLTKGTKVILEND